jgi:hypothetical protein
MAPMSSANDPSNRFTTTLYITLVFPIFLYIVSKQNQQNNFTLHTRKHDIQKRRIKRKKEKIANARRNAPSYMSRCPQLCHS